MLEIEMFRSVLFVPIFLGLTAAVPSMSKPAGDGWITLGTQGGPMPDAKRSQPANVLMLADGNAILVDAGDGAVEQLTKAGIPLAKVHTLFLSHLHFDHTAGVLGVLGLRYQTNQAGVLTIYGPPGTKQFIDGQIASMQPEADAGYGLPGESKTPPASTVHVVELTGGASVRLAGVTVTAAQNTHYSFPPGSDMDKRFKSLAYRFDLPERSIVYTGDTGPSDAVVKLAHDADLLVSEMIDVPATVKKVEQANPNLSGDMKAGMIKHLATHHLTPDQVGALAAKAGVKAVVLTHLVPGNMDGGQEAEYKSRIGQEYKGKVTFAQDLEKF